MTFVRQAGVLKWEEYDSSDFKMFNGNIVPRSCASLGKISSVTPEIASIRNAPV